MQITQIDWQEIAEDLQEQARQVIAVGGTASAYRADMVTAPGDPAEILLTNHPVQGGMATYSWRGMRWQCTAHDIVGAVAAMIDIEDGWAEELGDHYDQPAWVAEARSWLKDRSGRHRRGAAPYAGPILPTGQGGP